MDRMERRSSGPTYKVIFYRTTQGAEPVREWLQSLEKPERFQLGKAIQVLQMNGPELSMPYACPLGGGFLNCASGLAKSAIASSMDLMVDGSRFCCMPR
jgi:hypothetical protein